MYALVDCNNFFVSCERAFQPELEGRPVVVLSNNDGCVVARSNESKAMGIKMGTPFFKVRQMVDSGRLIVRSSNYTLYGDLSRRVMKILSDTIPSIEVYSIDEAFLDITGSLHLYGGDKTKLGEALRREIRETCGVTCSVGIAPNRLLAKIGSEQHKPDGLTLMPFEPDAIAAFLAPKPIGILWGIGKKTEAALRPYGLVTCGDLQRTPLRQLETILGSGVAAVSLQDYAFGRSDDHVYWESEEEKSVSREHTFGEDEYDRAVVRAKLLELVAEVGHRFRTERRWARTAKLKLRDADFNTITRQVPFDAPARDDISFREKALELFDREKISSVRLIGFGVTNIRETPDSGELLLFADPKDERREKRERLSATLDALRAKGLGV